MFPLTTDTFCTGAYFFDRRSRSFRRIRTHPFPLCDENLLFAYGRSRIRSRLRWSSSRANCLMADGLSSLAIRRFDRAEIFALAADDDDAPASQIGGLLGIGALGHGGQITAA